jgi:hypothetical protein
MKTMTSFVTNSSSTSYILEIPADIKAKGDRVLRSAGDVLFFCEKEDTDTETCSKLLTIINRGNQAMIVSVDNSYPEVGVLLRIFGIECEELYNL